MPAGLVLQGTEAGGRWATREVEQARGCGGGRPEHTDQGGGAEEPVPADHYVGQVQVIQHDLRYAHEDFLALNAAIVAPHRHLNIDKAFTVTDSLRYVFMKQSIFINFPASKIIILMRDFRIHILLFIIDSLKIGV